MCFLNEFVFFSAQPSDLKAVPENGCLTLTWSFPVQNQIKVESYKIVYTCTSDDWTHANWISVDANELYCVIPNVIPMKTYRFKVSACVKDHNGKLSDEHCFNSGCKLYNHCVILDLEYLNLVVSTYYKCIYN